MHRLGRLAVAVLLAWSGVVGMPRAAQAAQSAHSAHSARGPVEAPGVAVGDTDGDGLPEVSTSGVAGGPCACRCPIVGGAGGAEAAGVELTGDLRSALVVCGTRTAVAVDPAAPDAGAPPGAAAGVQVNPNGLGRGGPAG